MQIVFFVCSECVKTTQYSTQPASQSQDTNTGRGKGEDGDYYERRREDGDLPSFPKLKSLYYYWPLTILIYLSEYLSNNKQGKFDIAPELVICIIISKSPSPYPGNIPSIPDYIIIACTVTVQLPMRVLHGMCYSYTSGGGDQSPNVVYYCWAIV
jgi:hypothetical protein